MNIYFTNFNIVISIDLYIVTPRYLLLLTLLSLNVLDRVELLRTFVSTR